jgi:hypothetical protein
MSRKLPRGTTQQVTYQVPVDRGRPGCLSIIGMLALLLLVAAMLGALV